MRPFDFLLLPQTNSCTVPQHCTLKWSDSQLEDGHLQKRGSHGMSHFMRQRAAEENQWRDHEKWNEAIVADGKHWSHQQYDGSTAAKHCDRDLQASEKGF